MSHRNELFNQKCSASPVILALLHKSLVVWILLCLWFNKIKTKQRGGKKSNSIYPTAYGEMYKRVAMDVMKMDLPTNPRGQALRTR